MTNVSSGSKRPHDSISNGNGSDFDSHKRPREDSHTPRDWRDVHLKSSASSRPHDRDRERDRDRRHSDRDRERDRRYSDRDRDIDRRSTFSGGGGRGRDYDDHRSSRRDHSRDSARSREYGHSRRDVLPYDSPKRKDELRRRSPASSRGSVNGHSTHGSKPPATNGAKISESDKEEGEISPHPPARDPTPPPPRRRGSPPRGPRDRTQTAPAASSSTTSATQRSAAPAPAPEPEPEIELPPSPKPLELTLAERRAKREAIRAKYAGVSSVNSIAASQTTPTTAAVTPAVGPSPSPALGTGMETGLQSSAVQPPQNMNVSDADQTVSQSQSQSQPVVKVDGQDEKMNVDDTRASASASPTPHDFELAKAGDEESAQVEAQAQAATVSGHADGTQQISAADYDPSLDRREDEERRVRGNGHVYTNGNGNGVQVKQESSEVPDVEMIEEEEEVVEEEEEDDLDDMFAIASGEKKKAKKMKRKKVAKPTVPAPVLITSTLDTASDSEGYYQIVLGEILDGGRYQVFSSLGKGMFANVVRARVLQDDLQGQGGQTDGASGSGSGKEREVAIKIIRSQESMYKAGLKEVQMLNKLRQADPEDKKHVVKLERTFEHRGHLCLVFESLSMNLRDVVKRFGKDVGLNIRAVRAYAHQLFLSMSLLRKCNVMHADIKPDNILVNDSKTLLKLCDLGSASDASENDITPYLVSRFYRAPEIILGIPYDPALDIWSIGCTLYELYTGKILFPGKSNNQMLLLMQECRGRFNGKMVKRARFGDVYFDEMGAFLSVDVDRVTGNDVIKKVHLAKPTRDLRARLMPSGVAAQAMKDDERKMVSSFVDLLEKCLVLDPARRITPKEALGHQFIRGT